VDGNIGSCAGVAEMLIQSHIRPDPVNQPDVYEVHLLPALPKAWPSGSVTGLRARGGHEIDFSWQNGNVTSVKIKSLRGHPLKLRYGNKTTELKLNAGETRDLIDL
jgi:alpha-L-fucosidase 2